MKLTTRNSLVGFLSLSAGIAFCILLFSYGVTQEVPIGQLEGSVLLAETGKPLSEAEISLSVHDDDRARDRYVTADKRGHFRFRNLKAGEYDINVSASEHTSKARTIQVTEGKATRVSISLAPNEPYLKLYASQRVWMPAEPPQLEMHGFRVGDSVDVEVDRIGFDSLLTKGMFATAIKALRSESGVAVPPEFSSVLTKTMSFRHSVKNRDTEGAFINSLAIPVLPEGLYWVICQGKGTRVATYLNVSRIALVTKTAEGHALAFVTDLVTGKPVQGATIWAQSSSTNVMKAATNADGLAESQYSSSDDQSDNRSAIVATLGASVATVGVYTSADAQNSGDARFVIYTDRPIYRPGDEVQFKGIVRRTLRERYLPPTSGPVNVEINDTDDQPIAKLLLRASSHGTFSGHFTTSKEAGPGLYRVVAKGFGGRGSHFVNMLAYRKPEMSIQLKPMRANYMIGDKVQVMVQCSYYFGGPVVGAKLQAHVYASPTWNNDPENEPDEVSANSFSGGELSKAIESVTDDKGQAVIEFETRQAGDHSVPLCDLDFGVDVSMTDASNKYVDSTSTVRVTRGAINLKAASQNFFAKPGQVIELLLSATSNTPSHAPIVNQPIKVSVARESWIKNKMVLKPIRSLNLVTGPDGKAVIPVSMIDGGSMLLSAETEDDMGHKILSEDRVYLSGSSWRADTDQAKLEVTLDKRRYRVGDTATIMLRTLVPGGSALVTLQTNRVMWKKVVGLTQNTTYVQLLVDPSLSPNCFVSVAYIHKKKFYEGNTRLSVDPGIHRLNVSVESEKPVYQPGEKALLTVRTRDPEGHPVPAEVSVGVVDESIYAIHEDDFNIIEAFYPKRNNEVTTSFSFAEVYLDGGDKGGANVAVRRKFLDTATWLPSIQTDKDGRATVLATLPDNLTEWRATVVGATDRSLVGMGITKFKARKNLMVRLEMPGFLVQQDESRMSLIITNDTGIDQDVHVSLESTGVTVLGDKRQSVRVSSERPTSLTFQLRTNQPGLASLTAKAWVDGGPSDGVQQGFPVLAHGIPIRQSWSAEVKETKDFEVKLEPGTDLTTGRLKVDFSASLAGGLVASLDGLVGFPYGCVEQTMSRFMPSILVAKALRDLGIPRPDLEKQIPRIAGDSMIRLARMQHSDGGWGWWENDDSDPFMTALVLDGLERCRRAGYTIRKVDIGKALEWSSKRSTSKEWKDDSLRSKSYIVYVLARYGRPDAAEKAYTSLHLNRASAACLATLALAKNELGPVQRADRDYLLGRLVAMIHQGPLGAYWSDSDWEWGSESTALGLTALMAISPNDSTIPKVVRYLMLSRKGALWDSTRDTSYSLIGLTEYLAKTHGLTSSFDATISLNGRTIKRTHLDGLLPDSQSTAIEIPLSSLRVGPNTIRIEKSGSGVGFAALNLQATQIQRVISPVTPIPGLSITRKYYRMESRSLEDGTVRLLPSRSPVERVLSGDTIRVELTIQSNKPRQFILIEDPTPSNCRVTEREQLDEGETWSFWWDRTVVRDEKIGFFVRNLHEGKQILTYNMRAEGLGTANALPTSLSSMYDVTVNASGAESRMVVK